MDLRDQVRKLVDYWIDHNHEHEVEMQEWAGKVTPLGPQVADALQKAAASLAEASAALAEAKEALQNPPEG